MNENLSIKEILAGKQRRDDERKEQERQDWKFVKQCIEDKAKKNEADIEKLKSSQPSGWLDKIIALYRDTITDTEEYFERSEYVLWLCSFATFLYNQRLYHLIDNLYDRSLAIYRELGDLPNVAGILINMATFHDETNRAEEAEEEYQEALRICRDLAVMDSSTYLPYVAVTLNNLATFHHVADRIKEAEKEYKKALSIRRELAKTNPSIYLPDVVMTLNNLAILYVETDRCEEAEKLCQEALGIYQGFAELVPGVYQPMIEKTLKILNLIQQEKSAR